MKTAYIYNIPDWAVHNVGKLWFGHRDDVDLLNWHNTSGEELKKYDHIIFGLYTIYEDFKYNKHNCTVVIHDPCEVFDQNVGWKQSHKVTSAANKIKHIRNLIVISEEMEYRIHKEIGRMTYRIPTMTLDEPGEVKDRETCKVISIFNRYPRKRPDFIVKLQKQLKNAGIEMYIKTTKDNMLSREEYIQKLDSHDIYVCASFQEGGPLPALDAMNRGLMVISTPVGQMREMIKTGHNGILCNHLSIKQWIEHLNENRGEIKRMQKASLETIRKQRNIQDIRKTVDDYLERKSHEE